MLNTKWIEKAVEIVSAGTADKLVKDGVTVYAVKDIIRIDIHNQEG